MCWAVNHHMAVSILFFARNETRRTFSMIWRRFSTFPPSRKVFLRRDLFCKFSWHRCDSIGPKIIEIRAVLTIFRPFEVSRMLSCFSSRLIFQGRCKIEMAISYSLFLDGCLLYTSPSPRDGLLSRMPSSA